MTADELAQFVFDAHFVFFPQEKTAEWKEQPKHLKEIYIRHARAALEKAGGEDKLAILYMGQFFSPQHAATIATHKRGMTFCVESLEKILGSMKSMASY